MKKKKERERERNRKHTNQSFVQIQNECRFAGGWREPQGTVISGRVSGRTCGLDRSSSSTIFVNSVPLLFSSWVSAFAAATKYGAETTAERTTLLLWFWFYEWSARVNVCGKGAQVRGSLQKCWLFVFNADMPLVQTNEQI